MIAGLDGDCEWRRAPRRGWHHAYQSFQVRSPTAYTPSGVKAASGPLGTGSGSRCLLALVKRGRLRGKGRQIYDH